MTAHREHLYQRLVQCGYSHAAISTAFGVTSLILGAFAVTAKKSGGTPRTIFLTATAATAIAYAAGEYVVTRARNNQMFTSA